MPELPEISAIKSHLSSEICLKTIKDVKVNDASFLQNVSVSGLITSLTGKVITGVEQRGKYLSIVLQDDSKLILHFMLTGNILLNNAPAYSAVELELCNGKYVKIWDLRRLMKIWYVTPMAFGMTGVLDKLGPEPMSDAFNLTYLKKKCKYNSKPIKAVLIDQSVVAGIGNFYSDEILFQSDIDPEALARDLDDTQLHTLYTSIRNVLEFFSKKCEKMCPDTLGFDSFESQVRSLGSVHGRVNQPCKVCGTTIKKIQVAGKTTCFCPWCQRESK